MLIRGCRHSDASVAQNYRNALTALLELSHVIGKLEEAGVTVNYQSDASISLSGGRWA